MKRLFCLLLMGLLVAQDSPFGENQQPKIKTPFTLDYHHLPTRDTSTIKGDVVNPQIVDTFNTQFNNAIIDRVLAIRFEPAKQNGKPVKVRYQLPILFK